MALYQPEKRIARIGYREVELYELPGSPSEFGRIVADAGLRCVAGHVEQESLKSDATIAAATALGLEYLVVVFPVLPALQGSPMPGFHELVPLFEKITLDDFRWNAEQLNRLGQKLKRDGLRLGYHNHAVEFKRFGDALGLDVLIRSTDPELVTFELDCGHAVHAGQDPIACLERYPDRFELLHVKDLEPGFQVTTSLRAELEGTDAEIGAGVIDWKRAFETARRTKMAHYFVEHEGKMAHAPMEAIRNSYRYLNGMLYNARDF